MTKPTPYPALGRFLTEQLGFYWPNTTKNDIANAVTDMRAEKSPDGTKLEATTIGRWMKGENPPKGENLRLLLDYIKDSPQFDHENNNIQDWDYAIAFLAQPIDVVSRWYERDDVPAIILNTLKVVHPKPIENEVDAASEFNIRGNEFGRAAFDKVDVEDGGRFNIEATRSEIFIATNIRVTGGKRSDKRSD